MNTQVPLCEENCTENMDAELSEELVALITLIVTAPKLPEDLEISPALQETPGFQRLFDCLMDARAMSHALSRGDLKQIVYNKGFILSNMKALQANLRHLTWQTKKVADGDFSQRVDFLGEFSDAFNEMTQKLKDSSLQLQYLANIDALTHIPNRLALEQFLTETFTQARKNSLPFSLLILDIDHFKSVNDTHGHIAGDQVLVEVTRILNRQFRSSDIFARYGGEEFVAGLPGIDLESAVQVAERARKAVETSPISIENNAFLNVTISIGISSIRDSDKDYQDIIERSDKALYEAKDSGRNRIACQ